MKKIRVLIADDHTLVREGLRALLEAQGDFEVIGEASNGQEAVERAQEMRPDVVLAAGRVRAKSPPLASSETT